MPAPRRGFALIFVLWVVASASALGFGLSTIGRGELNLIRNRGLAMQAEWRVLGCLDRVRAQAEEQIWSDGYTPSSADGAWENLDRLISPSRDCRVTIRPGGLAVDVNSASRDQLRRFFVKLDMGFERADSLASAIVDWRDPDDQAFDGESEAAWYRDRGRIPPRNRPFADPAELTLVRGIDAALMERRILGVALEPILWRRADAAVLSTLPGMTDEALAVLAAHRSADLTNLTMMVDFPELSPIARDSLARASRALLPTITSRVQAWTVEAVSLDSSASYVRASLKLGLRTGRLEMLERRLTP